MPYNPKISRAVLSYIPVGMKRRMERIAKKYPRLTQSAQVEAALRHHLPLLEQQAGIVTRSGDRMP